MSKRFKNFLKTQSILEGWHGLWTEYWLVPSGSLERAPDGHYNWAEQKGILRIDKELWDNREYVYLAMAKKGYVRIVETGAEIFYQKYIHTLGEKFVVNLNRLQTQSLRDLGIEKNKSVVGVGTAEQPVVLFEPKNINLGENTVVGINEPVEINGIGSISAKVDSGNDGYNVIHGTNLQRLKNAEGKIIVKFNTVNDQTVSFVQVGWVEVVAGGKVHQRPVIQLNIRVKNKFFQNEPFSVADRSQNDEKILLGVPFIKKLDAVIDVNKAEVVSEVHNEQHEKIIKAHNDYIDKQIESLKKDMVSTEAERDYAMEHKGEGWKVYNDRIDNILKEISALEGKKLIHAAVTKSRLGEFRKGLMA